MPLIVHVNAAISPGEREEMAARRDAGGYGVTVTVAVRATLFQVPVIVTLMLLLTVPVLMVTPTLVAPAR